MLLRLVPSIQSRNSTSLPAAQAPPTSAPLDAPAIATMFIPRACSASITPICASPRAPPAPSTSATGSPLVIVAAPVPATGQSW